MLIAHFFDLIPIWFLLIGTVGLMVLFIEFGFSLGTKARATAKKSQTSQVRAIMGAGLGLLAYSHSVRPNRILKPGCKAWRKKHVSPGTRLCRPT